MDDLESMLGEHGLGSYMDQNINRPRFNDTGLGLMLREIGTKHQENLLNLKHKLLLLKYQFPQLSDHEIGRMVLNTNLDLDLNNTLFSKEHDINQQRMKNPTYGSY